MEKQQMHEDIIPGIILGKYLDCPKNKTIHQLFEEQVEKTPNHIAVNFKDKHLTYRRLNKRANQLAHHLVKQGIKSETLVAIYLEPGLETVIGILGILKAGGAYVPIDPNYPAARIRHFICDIQAPIVLTQQKLKDHFTDSIFENQLSSQLICLDDDWNKIAKENTENIKPPPYSNSLAYVIY